MNWFFTKQTAPPMYGAVHMELLATVFVLVWILCRLLRKKKPEQILTILNICGIMLAFMEIFKQIMLYHINGYFDWWRFPFQICSVPMYLCLLLPFTGGKIRNAILCYLYSFCFLGAFCALLFPQDMLSIYPWMTIHSFVWHGILIFISMLIVTHKMEGTRADFFHACILFLILAGTAEIINQIGAQVSTHALPDMFYISPYTRTLQPFFKQIQNFFGRNLEIIVYLLFYMLGCGGIHYLTYCIFHRENNTPTHK